MSSGISDSREHDVGLLVAAAGSSRRFGGAGSKLLRRLNGRPVVCHCLSRLAPVVPPSLTVVVVPCGRLQTFQAALADLPGASEFCVVEGGNSRQESVHIGLEHLPDRAGIVAVQDAARPQTDAELLRACIASAREFGSGVAARPVTDTIKLVDEHGTVVETLDRSRLWAAETPQVFERALITRAYARAARCGLSVTDDAQAVELLGDQVILVRAEPANPKITHPVDLAILEAMHTARAEAPCQRQ